MWPPHHQLKIPPNIHKGKQGIESPFSMGHKLDLLNSNLISLSLSSIKNKTDLRNTQLRPSSTSRDINLPSIDTSTHEHIYFSFQSSKQVSWWG